MIVYLYDFSFSQECFPNLLSFTYCRYSLKNIPRILIVSCFSLIIIFGVLFFFYFWICNVSFVLIVGILVFSRFIVAPVALVRVSKNSRKFFTDSWFCRNRLESLIYCYLYWRLILVFASHTMVEKVDIPVLNLIKKIYVLGSKAIISYDRTVVFIKYSNDFDRSLRYSQFFHCFKKKCSILLIPFPRSLCDR